MLGDCILLLLGIIVNDSLGTQGAQEPITHRVCVGDGFQGGEGLRSDDDQGGFGVQILGGLTHVGRINIGDETALQTLLNVGLKSFVGHDGAQIRATNSHVDHSLHGLASDTNPFTRANAVCEGIDAFQNLANIGDNVASIDDKLLVRRATQCRVEDGTVFSHVNAIASQHRVTKSENLGLIGQCKKLFQSGIIDQVLGQINMQVCHIQRPLLGALRIVLEPCAQVGVKDLRMLVQFCPGRGRRRVNCAHRAFS